MVCLGNKQITVVFEIAFKYFISDSFLLTVMAMVYFFRRLILMRMASGVGGGEDALTDSPTKSACR